MRILLHVLTRADAELAQKMIAAQKLKIENQVEVVDLTQAEPDYRELLEKIFKADSVQVW